MNYFPVLLFAAVFINYQLQAQPIRKHRTRRNAFRNESRLWPKAVVPYVISEAYNSHEVDVIENAMRDIHSVSCIRFKRRKNEKAYVEVVREKGCRAVVGYVGRRQKLTLGPGCVWIARVLHELFHVLGFFHEHTRPDRDDYVIIHENNIKTASMSNFRKMSDAKVTTFGLPYDYASVLHYHDSEFAIDRSQKTIEPKKKVVGKGIGKALNLSEMDIKKLNKLYRCSNKKPFDMEDDDGSGSIDIEENYIIV
ncbi:astacin-like metalloprotease toxin 5 [Stegodyphus dumicola]|uniref:astacin-like metalloprotease toxin 5 n=1 Tax=Stegodyphus dumicola TaxID=202533 RepID=UPI0015A9BA9E|nr:astacin-like metalloprotease toxin 5 [Stegodyphus dumicola]